MIYTCTWQHYFLIKYKIQRFKFISVNRSAFCVCYQQILRFWTLKRVIWHFQKISFTSNFCKINRCIRSSCEYFSSHRFNLTSSSFTAFTSIMNLFCLKLVLSCFVLKLNDKNRKQYDKAVLVKTMI